MIRGEYLGKKFYFSKREYLGLLERFDRNNARKDADDRFWIEEECTLCYLASGKRRLLCKGCTFKKYAGEDMLGCVIFLDTLLSRGRIFYLSGRHIWWTEKVDTIASNQLLFIRNLLLRLGKENKKVWNESIKRC